MAGVVLETLSNKKLIIFGLLILLLQISAYLIGGLISPKPYNVQQITSTACVDRSTTYNESLWFWSRLEDKCESTDDLSFDSNLRADQIVFTFQFPTPKQRKELDMSRWHQNMVGVLVPEIEYKKEHQVGKHPVMTLHARLGARDKHEPVKQWREVASSLTDRDMSCNPPSKKEDGHHYDYEPLPLFELGSVHYDHYLLNIRLPSIDEDTNAAIGKLTHLSLVVIHPNGGFTKVWFSMKIVLFPVLLVALIWYWVRVLRQYREPNLLEKTVFALGVAMTFLNLPVELFTLWVYMPFMLFYSDVRQGIFYAVLLCFWVIFAGEHLMDTIEKGSLTAYWKQLSGVLFGCACLFAFELSERGFQTYNPFSSIWANRTSSNMAYAFIILAGVAACIYLLFLLGLMVRVWRSINSKKGGLPSMPKARRKYYMGIIYRFKFMILTTLFCAALTVAFFIVGQTSEGYWKWDEVPFMEYGSAFLTGVYGMWNLYVFSMLILYAPSTKILSSSLHGGDSEGEEEIEFTNIPSETSSIAEFARKAAAD